MVRKPEGHLKARIAVLALVLAGCRNPTEMPYLGKWNGGFVPDPAAQKAPFWPKGYLQIYGTGHKYEIYLQGPQQSWTGKGTWRAEAGRLLLDTPELAVDDGGGQDRRDPNLPFIATDAIKQTYGRPMSLALSRDQKSLIGLLVTLDGRTGRHEFRKVAVKYSEQIRGTRPK